MIWLKISYLFYKYNFIFINFATSGTYTVFECCIYNFVQNSPKRTKTSKGTKIIIKNYMYLHDSQVDHILFMHYMHTYNHIQHTYTPLSFSSEAPLLFHFLLYSFFRSHFLVFLTSETIKSIPIIFTRKYLAGMQNCIDSTMHMSACYCYFSSYICLVFSSFYLSIAVFSNIYSDIFNVLKSYILFCFCVKLVVVKKKIRCILELTQSNVFICTIIMMYEKHPYF